MNLQDFCEKIGVEKLFIASDGICKSCGLEQSSEPSFSAEPCDCCGVEGAQLIHVRGTNLEDGDTYCYEVCLHCALDIYKGTKAAGGRACAREE